MASGSCIGVRAASAPTMRDVQQLAATLPHLVRIPPLCSMAFSLPSTPMAAPRMVVGARAAPTHPMRDLRQLVAAVPPLVRIPQLSHLPHSGAAMPAAPIAPAAAAAAIGTRATSESVMHELQRLAAAVPPLVHIPRLESLDSAHLQLVERAVGTRASAHLGSDPHAFAASVPELQNRSNLACTSSDGDNFTPGALGSVTAPMAVRTDTYATTGPASRIPTAGLTTDVPAVAAHMPSSFKSASVGVGRQARALGAASVPPLAPVPMAASAKTTSRSAVAALVVPAVPATVATPVKPLCTTVRTVARTATPLRDSYVSVGQRVSAARKAELAFFSASLPCPDDTAARSCSQTMVDADLPVPHVIGAKVSSTCVPEAVLSTMSAHVVVGPLSTFAALVAKYSRGE